MKSWRLPFLVLVIVSLSVMVASAGSSLDYGTVPGTPAVGTVTWVAWQGSTNPPAQVLTEDSFNPGTCGTNCGYRLISGIPSWALQVSQFTNPAPVSGNLVTILLSGSSGQNWRGSFSWTNVGTQTNHGEATAVSADACPIMLSGSQDVTGKTLNWSGSSASYLVYRSQNGSGFTPDNGASNGRYDYAATVSGTTYKDTLCPTGTRCWHIVVPAGVGGAINGCHSQEGNPTAVTMSTFRSADPTVNWPLIVGVGALVAAVIAGLVVFRRRATTH